MASGTSRSVASAALLFAALVPFVLDVLAPSASGDLGSESRSAGDVYERKTSIRECLRYVASDLKVRHDREPTTGPAALLIVADPTASMRPTLTAVEESLRDAWAAGPTGLKIGVSGVRAESVAPTGIPAEVTSVLQGLQRLPVEGPKNLHEAVRHAAADLAESFHGPRAIVLMTREGGDAEDDVEETRDALLDAGVVFYAVAPEAAFERPWEYDFEPNEAPHLGTAERFHPEPRRKEKGTFFVSGEVPFGLVPYSWERDFAQASFVWVRPPAWPVPAGFGYWNLATLAFTTGGRYFVFDFEAAVPSRGLEVRKTLYDASRLRHVAPDLRPRDRVLKDLGRDPRATAILRVWGLLADEAAPVLTDLATLEVRGGALAMRPARVVRSAASPRYWLEDEEQVEEEVSVAKSRVALLDRALETWKSAEAKDRDAPDGAPETLVERVEADFQLLGVQLLKVRFHWGEILAALQEIRPLDLSYRRVRIAPVKVLTGARAPATPVRLGSEEREARFAELVSAQERMLRRYPDTPWALLLDKGHVNSFRKDVQVLPPEETEPKKPEKDPKEPGKKPPAKPPSAPPKPPPPGPRPGSGGAGPTTGG